ncbi:ring canal kelch homolog isoform X2 [Colias croceus]|uniref:ring canal kelch homolog isoform X2 n=1 Tax=Colias crocea TaxID=72248 RepID=UPI001E27C12B|nr:ring canal kelch homolog isoform X2 [Colias croceus]
MEGDNAAPEQEQAAGGGEHSAAEGDGDRGSMMDRCPSQSSLDESSQRRESGEQEAGAQHATQLLDALSRLRRDALLCDVRLQAQIDGTSRVSEGVWAHRAVLAACSPYFRAMFTQFTERTRPTVTIQNVEPSALEAIIEYVYNPDSLVITEDNVQSVLSGASLVQVAGARAACCAFLAAALSPDNALGIRAFADLHACADLAHTAATFVHKHFVEVIPPTHRPTHTHIRAFADLHACADLAHTAATFVHKHFVEVIPPTHRPTHTHIRAFADLHACADLAHTAATFVHKHFVEVLETEEFLTLDADTLAQLLASDQITVPNEEVILDAVVRWMQHDPESRRPQLGALLEHVRLPLLPQDVLVARAAAEPLASAELRVKDLVIEALSFHLVRGSGRALAGGGGGGPRTRPRCPPRAPAALLVVGGQAPKAVRDVEALELGGGGWRAAAELPSRRCRAGLAAVGGRLYAVGGFNGTLRVRSVDVYDVAADAWSAGPPLAARRSTLGVAVIGHVIYAVGGFDGATGLSSAEALDTREGVWRPLAPMSTRRSSVGVAVLDGKLYAVGGYDGASRQCLSSVERYDPAAGAWEAVAEMGARRSGAGVGVAGGALYALGGHDGPAVRRSAERYRPGAGGGGWAPAPPMAAARRNAAVAAHLGRLYVVGGDDGAANLATVEVFDPTTEQWTTLPSAMSLGRSYAGVAVVERAL